MAVKRVVTNIAASRPELARAFYGTILGLEVVMDHGWIVTFAAPGATAAPQISVASAGGSGTPVPDISVEVDDLDEVLHRVTAAGLPVEYGPEHEPWGGEALLRARSVRAARQHPRSPVSPNPIEPERVRSPDPSGRAPRP